MKTKNKSRKTRKIKATFPNFMGDETKEITIRELEENHHGCLLIDPVHDKAVTVKEIETLDLREVVVMPPIQGG